MSGYDDGRGGLWAEVVAAAWQRRGNGKVVSARLMSGL